MDKFGIFNILNSLLGSKSDDTAQNSGGSPDVNGLINSLLNTKKPPAVPEKNSSTPPIPLQTSMISTMNSHDAFVKRVMAKNNKKQ